MVGEGYGRGQNVVKIKYGVTKIIGEVENEWGCDACGAKNMGLRVNWADFKGGEGLSKCTWVRDFI